MKKRDFIELWTYGTYDKESDTDFGVSFEVPKKWLESRIKSLGYKTLGEFYDDYIWCTTEPIMIAAENEDVLLNKKCGRFGHELYKKDIGEIKV